MWTKSSITPSVLLSVWYCCNFYLIGRIFEFNNNAPIPDLQKKKVE